MMAAIAAILGFLSSVAPMLVQWLTLKETNAHAVEMEKLRQQGAREAAAAQVDVANIQVDARQQDHIYDFASGSSGYRFVDALAAVIRPYVTWVFFHFYLLMKAALFVYGVNHGYDLGQMVRLMWDETDSAIFAAVMGFWFGNRMIVRSQQMPATQAVVKGEKT